MDTRIPIDVVTSVESYRNKHGFNHIHSSKNMCGYVSDMDSVCILRIHTTLSSSSPPCTGLPVLVGREGAMSGGG